MSFRDRHAPDCLIVVFDNPTRPCTCGAAGTHKAIWDDRNNPDLMRHVRVLFGDDGSMSIDKMVSHRDASIVDSGHGFYVGPSDCVLFVIDASDNAKHLIGRHHARQPLAPPTDGRIGWFEGVIRRDVA